MTAVPPAGTGNAALAKLGTDTAEFDCCDTTFRIGAWGRNASAAVAESVETARALEGKLDAFSDESAVAELAETGSVVDHDVARVVERALAYLDRTDGYFDPRHGDVEASVKAYIDGDADEVSVAFGDGEVTVRGARVDSDVRLDLNGLAKGYLVDRAAEALAGLGRRGFVDGGGDVSPPPGPVAVESPAGDVVTVLDTDWAVASSGNYRRRRGDVDHLYDPLSGRVGARSDAVTVVAERDVMEADALATALAVAPLSTALPLADEWPGLEALVQRDGETHRTAGFGAHELD